MAQYRTGTVSVTNGSAVVTGDGTEWVTEGILPGNLFSKGTDRVWYQVLSIQSETQLTLASAFVGTTDTDASYALHKDFTTTQTFPVPAYGDANVGSLLARAFNQIDAQIAALASLGTWRIADGIPSDLVGNDDDLAVDPATKDLFLKENGVWINIGKTYGAAWLSGSGVPDDSLGANGDFYVRMDGDEGYTSTIGDIYKKAGDTWSYISNIRGARGPVGEPAPLIGRGVYASGTTYAHSDIVSYNDATYFSRIDGNIGNQPDSNPDDWQVLVAPPTINEILTELGVTKITISNLPPSGGEDGNLWLKI